MKTHEFLSRLSAALVLVALMPFSCLSGPVAKVDYIVERSESELRKPVEKLELCRNIQTILGFTNGLPVHETIVGWAVKKCDDDQPPMLVEEAILFFEMREAKTNCWIIACIERIAGRSGRPGVETWREASHGRGMEWVSFSIGRPSEGDLEQFMNRSNFGFNECTEGIQPIHVAIYAPFKKLLKAAARGLPSPEKLRRYNGRSDIIWN